MLQTWDSFIGIVWLLTPFFLVWKYHNKKGVLLGALAFWVIGIIEGMILSYFDPNRESFIDGMWLVVGLPAGFVYSGIVYGVWYVYKKINAMGKKKK